MPDRSRQYRRTGERKARQARFGLLSDWYGEDYASTEITAHTVQPYLLNQDLDVLVNKFKRDSVRNYMDMVSRWRELVGEALSRMTSPGGMVDGRLALEVRHSALLRELNQVTEMIREKLNSEYGEDFCREIVLTASGTGNRKRSLNK